MMALYNKEFNYLIKAIRNADPSHKHKLTLLVVVPSHAFLASSLGGLLDPNEKLRCKISSFEPRPL